jgi:hypothetical protein
VWLWVRKEQYIVNQGTKGVKNKITVTFTEKLKVKDYLTAANRTVIELTFLSGLDGKFQGGAAGAGAG